ncbi:PAS domain S-box protein [Mucilaginibacter lacusdianchii]|uniref:PAS domain S-box protein n=1 Tax=Mucilaginibacter lacusdianchii TaxID=2684211 RepID=UPI00131E7C4F|nr:PAS domain S-box protein [Mucilaginibacter sp. JXJ CY 39]
MQVKDKAKKTKYGPFKIVAYYILISLLWITLSDQILFALEGNFSHRIFLLISSGKGFIFILATAWLIFTLTRLDQDKLLESEMQYRHMYEGNPNPMWIYDVATLQFVSVNSAAITSYGYSEEEFLRKSILDIRPTEDWRLLKQDVAELNSNPNKQGVWRHIKKDGTIIYANIALQKITFNNRACMMVVARDTTEKLVFEKQLEIINKTLLEQRSRLNETQRVAKLAGWEYIIDTKQLLWAKELYFITGVKPENDRKLLDIFLDYVHPDDVEAVKQTSKETLYSGKPMDMVYRLQGANGEVKYMRQLGNVEYKDGKPIKVIGSLQDVTELKILEQEKNKYLFNLEDTVNSITEIFFALNHDMEITLANKKFEQECGLLTSDVIGKKIIDLFPTNMINQNFYHAYERVIKERITITVEDYSKQLNQWLRMSGYPTQEGAAIYLTNITEQKTKDIQLKETVERFDFVKKATQLAVYDYHIPENHLTYDASASDWVNDPPQPGSNMTQWWHSHIHPEDVDGVVTSQQRVIAERGTTWSMEYRVYRGNGIYHYVLDQGYFLFNEQKEPVRLIGAIKDIEDIRRSNEDNKRLASIVLRITNMVTIVDTNDIITWVNKAFENFTGFTLAEISGKPLGTIMHGPNTSAETLAYIKQQQALQTAFSVDIVKYTKAGTPFWANVEFTPTYNECEKFTGYIVVCDNITQRKEHEEALERQNEALREVAWLSSHEIRRPAASILGLINLLEHTTNEEEKQECIAHINNCAHELDEIIHNITQKVENELNLNNIQPTDTTKTV